MLIPWQLIWNHTTFIFHLSGTSRKWSFFKQRVSQLNENKVKDVTSQNMFFPQSSPRELQRNFWRIIVKILSTNWTYQLNQNNHQLLYLTSQLVMRVTYDNHKTLEVLEVIFLCGVGGMFLLARCLFVPGTSLVNN